MAGAAPAVDGLVVVADGADVAAAARQLHHQRQLNLVGVLVLVYHDVLEMLLIDLQQGRLREPQLARVAEQVVVVHHVHAAQPFLVTPVDGGDARRVGKIHRGHIVWCLHIGFGQADAREPRVGVDALAVKLELGGDFAQQPLLVTLGGQREISAEADSVRIAAEDGAAEGVEGGDCGKSVTPCPIQKGDAFLHLVRRFVREGHRHDSFWGDAMPEHVSYALDNDPGLACACACEQEKRPLNLIHCLLLLWIEGECCHFNPLCPPCHLRPRSPPRPLAPPCPR